MPSVLYLLCYSIYLLVVHIQNTRSQQFYTFSHANSSTLYIVCTNESTASTRLEIITTEKHGNCLTCLRLQAAWAGVGLVVLALLMRLNTEPEPGCCVVGEL